MIFRNSLFFIALLSFAPISTVLAQAENQEQVAQEISAETQFENFMRLLALHKVGLEETLETTYNDNLAPEVRAHLSRINIALCHTTIKEFIEAVQKIKEDQSKESVELGKRVLNFLKSDLYAKIDTTIVDLLERIKELESQNS